MYIARKNVTVWVTKNALTVGIKRVDGCDVDKTTYAEYAVKNIGRMSSLDYLHARIGTDAFLSEKEAIDDVRKKIAAKLKSLEKQKKKLLRLQEEYKSR